MQQAASCRQAVRQHTHEAQTGILVFQEVLWGDTFSTAPQQCWDCQQSQGIALLKAVWFVPQQETFQGCAQSSGHCCKAVSTLNRCDSKCFEMNFHMQESLQEAWSALQDYEESREHPGTQHLDPDTHYQHPAPSSCTGEGCQP